MKLALTLGLHVLCAPVAAYAMPPERIIYLDKPAFRLSDGTSEAIVVPALSGRVMRFGRVGEPNLLWNLPAEKRTNQGFQNWGGDKTFVGPHTAWKTFADPIWPPAPSWDGPAHSFVVTPQGHLKVSGPPWRGFGVRVEREFWFENGEFVIRQTLEKVGGEARRLSIWNVTQAATPDAVFVPLNPNSVYSEGFYRFSKRKPMESERVSPSLLKIVPQSGAAYKIGADAPIAALIWVKGNLAWRTRAALLAGDYPDGAQNDGFPVEFYNHSDAGAEHYVELELFSPLRLFARGARWTQTVRWSLHRLPDENVDALAVREAVAALLGDAVE